MNTTQLTISDVTETSHKRKRHIDIGVYRVEYEKLVENGRVTYNKVCIGVRRAHGQYSNLDCFTPEVAREIGIALVRVQDESEYGDNRND